MTQSGLLWRGRDAHGACLIKFLALPLPSEHHQRLEQLTALRCSSLLVPRDLIADGQRLAVTFDEVPGTLLASRLETAGALPPMLARRVCADVAAALAVLHEAGLAHGDLSSNNVIVSDRAVVIDTLETGGYTPGYAAPERLSESELTVDELRCSDVWSFGKLAEEMGITHDVVQQCLDTDPAARPEASALKEAFELESTPAGVGVADTDGSDTCVATQLRNELAREHTVMRTAPGRHLRPARTRARKRLGMVLIPVGLLAGLIAVGIVGIPAFFSPEEQTSVAAAPAQKTVPKRSQSDQSDPSASPATSAPPSTSGSPSTSAPPATSGPANEPSGECRGKADSKRACMSVPAAEQILRELSTARTQAFTKADAARLSSVYTEGVDALSADQKLITQLKQNGVSLKRVEFAYDIESVSCEANPRVKAKVTQFSSQCVKEKCVDNEPSTQDLVFTLKPDPWRINKIDRK